MTPTDQGSRRHVPPGAIVAVIAAAVAAVVLIATFAGGSDGDGIDVVDDREQASLGDEADDADGGGSDFFDAADDNSTAESTAPPETRPAELQPPSPPPGQWAAVFASDPTRSVVDGVRAGLAGQVARPVEVFRSRDYRSLRPGYWVAGVRGFATSQQAIDLCFRLGRGNRSQCYARRLLNGPGISWDAPPGSGSTNPAYVVYPD